MTNKSLVFGLALALGVCFAESVVAEENMTRDQYKAEMADLDSRVAAAQAAIGRLESQIAMLNSDLDAIDADAAAVRAKTLSMLGVTEHEFKTAEKNLRSILSQLEGLSALAPEETFYRRSELDDIQARVAITKKRKL